MSTRAPDSNRDVPSVDAADRLVDARILLKYAAIFLCSYLGLGALFGLLERRVLHHRLGEKDVAPRHLQSATTKSAHYKNHAADYDLVFLGDSRTLCGLDPLVVDRILGSRSVNLAHWAHWLETQYPNYTDLVPAIPPSTRVVWSIGHVLFQPIRAAVNASYLIPLRLAPDYVAWGYGPLRILDNLSHSIPGLELFARRDQIRAGFDVRMNVPLRRPQIAPADLRNAERFGQLKTQLEADPNVARIDPFVEGDTITSAAVWMWGGNYRRVEFEHEFFRAKQREESLISNKEISGDTFQVDPPLWRTFIALLELFKANHVQLIVNEIHEAPYRYGNAKNARLYREVMDRVQREVTARGFRYLRVPFDTLTDEDYFDYDHLNDVGADKYSQLVAQQLLSAPKAP
jgi:hypothetical protein